MKRTIIYLLMLLITAIIVSSNSGCDSRVGTPDVRNEFKEDILPDYFGWKWKFKW